MKYSYILLTLALVFCTLEYTSAEIPEPDHFELPNELSVVYLNVSLLQIQQVCDKLGGCLGDQDRVIDDVKYHAGLRMIDQFANLMRDRPTVTDADWDSLVKNRCLNNIPMHIMVSLSMEISWTCALRDMHIRPEIIHTLHGDWVRHYCARIRRFAIQQYQQNRNRH